MLLTSKSGRLIELPSNDENTLINQGIASDPDTYELQTSEFNELKPVKSGRPKAQITKQRISIRLSPEVLAAFKASGKGWQSKIDNVLKDWLKEHPV
jgi:uncharacterized protein (DUF4415 family)